MRINNDSTVKTPNFMCLNIFIRLIIKSLDCQHHISQILAKSTFNTHNARHAEGARKIENLGV